MALAMVHRRLSLAAVRDATVDTTKLTAMVAMLLLGSTFFALVFRGLYGDIWIEQILTTLPGGKIGFLVLANLSIFLLGFFIDFFEIAFIIIPLLMPAARALGIDLVWFGVMIGVNLQTSFLTPPFGFALFYLRGVTPPSVRTTQIYRGVLPLILIQLLGLLGVCLFPDLVLRLVR
jgi:tripartite ATP-independent transporter DctM subunit